MTEPDERSDSEILLGLNIMWALAKSGDVKASRDLIKVLEAHVARLDPAPEPADLGVITHVCICGCNLWRILVTWDDYEIATYSLDMYCAECGAKAIAPTAIDRP